MTVNSDGGTGVLLENETSTYDDEAVRQNITVNGNVTVNGKAGTGIIVEEYNDGKDASHAVAVVKGNVTVSGGTEDDPSAGIGISGGTVAVTGNVTSSQNGAEVYLNGDATTLVVDGTLRGEKAALKFVNGITPSVTPDENGNPVVDDSEKPEYTYPTILVKTLETSAGGKLIDATADEYFDQKTIDAITASIQYIIDANGFDTLNANTVTVNGVTYKVAKSGDTVNLRPSVPEGYRLTGLDFGSYQTTVRDNGDGTYTVRVVDGGNLVFKANMEKIGQTATTPTSTTTSSNKNKSDNNKNSSSDKKSSSKSSSSTSSSGSGSGSGSSSSSSKSTSPKTGDSADTILWVLVFAAAAAGLGVAAKGARRERR